MAIPLMPSSRVTTTILSLCILSMIVYSLSFFTHYYHPISSRPAPVGVPQPSIHPQVTPSSHSQITTTLQPQATEKPKDNGITQWQKEAEAIIKEAKSFIGSPIEAPYKEKFHDVGERIKAFREWIKFIDTAPKSEDKHTVLETVESAVGSLFPFLTNSPKRPDSKTPLTDLRASIVPGSRGIVIPAGKGTLRFAAHLIGSLQEVLKSNLTIQIVYAGDDDFPPADRERLLSRFGDVQFMDILSLIDDTTAHLATGGWAIKPFAALYAPFEEVILLDADAVFVRPPETLFLDSSYSSTGVLLFHDRLLWQHAYRERHDWWRSQIHNPSPALNTSLVWTQDYAEEGDSGVVVIDKSRLDVFMGLLHVAWQNTHAVREDITYGITYGDKETWWFGFELSGSTYAFEEHYGSMVGWFREKVDDSKARICSFVIGHVDANDEVIWYNGGLLKNKKVDQHEFGLPTHTMVDGTWEKGEFKTDMSCMVGNNMGTLSKDASWILDKSINLAKDLDAKLGLVKEDGQ
ncbi:uncharacterized protein CTRU02_213300 [Colletotrichum truncatum]|uniref:Uncharacterized protein n=1 Tax=Colletotrichum truncatum TaxID=5467 RepID=A0ACC3YKM4_COLTU|nr:uncharacterized protein CTRU02_12679 [Colletotrichum truncatum]KAF6784417.1 hypothetical protein CTRU02_12679 [Colletotrichum truncatum]